MRFLVGGSGAGPALYAVTDSGAANLTAADPGFGSDLAPLIAMGASGLQRAADIAASADSVPLDTIAPQLPIAAPSKIICLGLNYAEHAREGGHEVPDYPALFMRTIASMSAAGEPIVRPVVSETFDYEAELMVVVGKGGRHIPRERALEHVFGYTIFNDGSVREYQRKTAQWTPGKNFDKSGAIGPVVVTPDEVPPGASGLGIRSILNGTVMQDSDTSDMIFPVDETIATISRFSELLPGDLIAMGTPPGVGHARRPPVWMKPGDTIVIEIDGIGRLENPVVDEAEIGRRGAAA